MQMYGPPLHDTSVCKLVSPQYPVNWKITFGDMKVKAVMDMSKELSGILNRSTSSLYCVWWPNRRRRIGVGRSDPSGRRRVANSFIICS